MNEQNAPLPPPDASAAQQIDKPCPIDPPAQLRADFAYSAQQTTANLINKQLRELRDGSDGQRRLR